MGDAYSFGSHSTVQLKDQVTPHKMALVVLIDEYCTLLVKTRDQALIGHRNDYSETEEREMLFELLQLIQSGDMNLKHLIGKVSVVAKPNLYETFTLSLKNICEDGIRCIMETFKQVSTAIFESDRPIPSKNSVLGLFLRRMILAFNKLSFSQIIKLHSQFKSYYKAWNPETDLDDSIADASMNIADFANITQNAGSENSCDFMAHYSQRQAEYFIAQQAAMLQNNESEALSPKDLQQRIQDLLKSNPDLAEAHYLSYLNYLRVNEFCSAMDSLYHYFDRHTGTTQGNLPASRFKPEEWVVNRGNRYAALNMASLHFRFNHREEALYAVQEAIRMAQEANDHICLQHALGWLQRLGEQGTGKSEYLLDKLVTKSSELNMAYLTSLGVQAFAKQNSIATKPPSSIFEFLMKSDLINSQNSLLDLMCVGFAHKVALWNMYGRNEMCSMSCQMMLRLNTFHMGVYHSGETECFALAHLAQISALKAQYKHSELILACAKKMFPTSSKHSRIWRMKESQLIFQRCIYNCKFAEAEKEVSKMSALDGMEAKYCKAKLLIEMGNANEASELLSHMMDELEGVGHAELICRIYLLQAEILCQTENPSEASQPLLSCLTKAKENHLCHMETQAVLNLAYVQFCLNMPLQAQTMLNRVVLEVLSEESIYDRARCKYLMVRCQVAAAKEALPIDRHKVLMSAVQSMNGVISLFKEAEAHWRTKDAVYYQARLFHELDYVQERNQCALEFRKLDEQYPTWDKASLLQL